MKFSSVIIFFLILCSADVFLISSLNLKQIEVSSYDATISAAYVKVIHIQSSKNGY